MLYIASRVLVYNPVTKSGILWTLTQWQKNTLAWLDIVISSITRQPASPRQRQNFSTQAPEIWRLSNYSLFTQCISCWSEARWTVTSSIRAFSMPAKHDNFLSSQTQKYVINQHVDYHSMNEWMNQSMNQWINEYYRYLSYLPAVTFHIMSHTPMCYPFTCVDLCIIP